MNGFSDREFVAVPDAAATEEAQAGRFRLGIRSTAPGSKFTLGESGKAGQKFHWVYLKGEGATYEVNLLDGKLTVTSRPGGEDVQAVVYKIDVEAMTGREITAGEAVSIVFAYDEPAENDTTVINDWVATTGPQYIEELKARLGKADDVVSEMQAEVGQAQEAGRYGEATRAPGQKAPERTQEPGPPNPYQQEYDHVAPTAGEDELEEVIDLEEPEAVRIPDPQSGVTYTGRRWGRGQRTSLRKLRNASYRVAILNLHNGESATIVLQHPDKLPALQLTTKRGLVRQFLSEEAWDTPLESGKPVTFEVDSPMDGDREIPRGMLPLPQIELTATGPQATKGSLELPESNALKLVRNRVRELQTGQGISRSLHSSQVPA